MNAVCFLISTAVSVAIYDYSIQSSIHYQSVRCRMRFESEGECLGVRYVVDVRILLSTPLHPSTPLHNSVTQFDMTWAAMKFDPYEDNECA